MHQTPDNAYRHSTFHPNKCDNEKSSGVLVIRVGWSFSHSVAHVCIENPRAPCCRCHISPRESIIDVNFNLWRWRSRLIGERRLNEFGARRQSSEFAPGGFFTLQCITAPSVLDLILCVLFQTLGCRTSCCAARALASNKKNVCLAQCAQYTRLDSIDQNKPTKSGLSFHFNAWNNLKCCHPKKIEVIYPWVKSGNKL
jgi:hypothetical protein